MTDTGNVDQTSIQNSEQTAEPTFSQSHVDAIAGRARQEGAEKARREFESKQQAAGIGHMPAALTEAQIREMIDERSSVKARELFDYQAKQNQEFQARQIGNQIEQEFSKKMMDAKTKYPDLDQVFDGVDLAQYPDIVFIANQCGEYTADIMYDIFSNDHKLANLIALASREKLEGSDMKKSRLVKSIHSIRDSIEKNATAKTYKEAPRPLRNIKSSNNAGLDNASLEDMTPDQLRKTDLFRA